METLLVAPKTNLLYASEEVSAVVNLLRARMIEGNVTADLLLDRLQERKWDIIWFATHGTPEGIYLSDGITSPEILVPLIRTSKANLVIFNTCESIEVAFALHNELLTDFVATIRPVPDKLSYITGKTFAIHLAAGLSPHKAWLQCKPGRNNMYIFLPGERFGNGNGKPMPSLGTNDKSSNEIAEEVERINIILEGSERWNIPGVLPTMKILMEETKELSSSLMFVRIQMALIFVMNIFTLSAIFFLIVRILGE